MVKLNIKITGLNGYLGRLISRDLKERGHMVSGIDRNSLYSPGSILETEIKSSDVIINLSGAPILKRWTEKNKKTIYESRITTTTNLVQAINVLEPEQRPKKFISASAIGIYQPGISHDEISTRYENKFVGKVVQDWEKCLNGLPDSIQLNIFRIGLVLGKNAKTIKNLRIPFNLGLGGKIGSGKQAFPFIHEKDLVKAFVWVVEDFNFNKTFNLVAPKKISNSEFTKALAKNLNRPAFMSVPEFVVKVFFGEAASLLLKSPEVEPKALLSNGFMFQFPTIESAISEIIK